MASNTIQQFFPSWSLILLQHQNGKEFPVQGKKIIVFLVSESLPVHGKISPVDHSLYRQFQLNLKIMTQLI